MTSPTSDTLFSTGAESSPPPPPIASLEIPTGVDVQTTPIELKIPIPSGFSVHTKAVTIPKVELPEYYQLSDIKVLDLSSEYKIPDLIKVPEIPEYKIPETLFPEYRLPEYQIPELRLPENRMPVITLPDLPKLPEIPKFEVSIPEFDKMSMMTIPRFELPSLKMPDMPSFITMPEIPNLELPSIDFDLSSIAGPVTDGGISAGAFAPQSLTSGVGTASVLLMAAAAAAVSSTFFKERDDVSVPYDAAARYYFDEWRRENNIGRFNKRQYEAFQRAFIEKSINSVKEKKKLRDLEELTKLGQYKPFFAHKTGPNPYFASEKPKAETILSQLFNGFLSILEEQIVQPETKF